MELAFLKSSFWSSTKKYLFQISEVRCRHVVRVPEPQPRFTGELLTFGDEYDGADEY